jgi:uncharacterized protein
MKKNFLFFALIVGLIPSVQSQTFEGSWEGKISAGVELRVVFNIKYHANGSFSATADSPDQSAYGLKCDTVIVTGNTVSIEMQNMNASYAGEMTNDSTIAGEFTQGAAIPLILKRTTKKTPVKIERPQTPQPPFPYKSEEVIYFNPDKSLQYGATITIPAGEGSFPAAVLITGSGPQDRDETLMGHKLFAVLADHLTRKGFIVLRVDDRGVGKTTGNFSEATSADFAKDVHNGVEYLLSRKETNKKRIGLIGHSEGGLIAPMVATQRKDIDFVILLAGPGVPIVDLMAEQNHAIATTAGISKEALNEIKPLFKKVVTAISNENDSLAAIANTSKIVEDWTFNKPIAVLEEMNLGSAESRAEYVKAMVAQLRGPWFRYFIKFDPTPYLQRLKGKVFAINGEKDIQVLPKQNLDGIRTALTGSNAEFEVKELPGLNHLFQTCKKCTIQEYGELAETFSPSALNIISEWMERRLK